MPKFIVHFAVLMLLASLGYAQERQIQLSPEGAQAVTITADSVISGDMVI